MGQPEDAFIATGRQLAAQHLDEPALAEVERNIRALVDGTAQLITDVARGGLLSDLRPRDIARTRITAGAITLALLGAYCRQLDADGRGEGLTWDRVGAARGVSGDSARQRATRVRRTRP